jgi:bifunctional non-homologous end joining protein LigD
MKTPRPKTTAGSGPQAGEAPASPVPDFIPFATCLLVDRPPNGPDWVHEIKLDGWRLQIRVEDGTATLRTRNGHDYSSTFPEFARVARGFDNCIIDGEVCFVGKDGITDFSGIRQASLQEIRERTDKSFRPDWINLPKEALKVVGCNPER